jgi:DNA repair exonuclease SbcCD ATPase subunit
MDRVNDVEQAQREVEQQPTELREEEQKERQAKMEETIDRLTQKARRLVDEQQRDMRRMNTADLPEYEQEGIERAQERLDKLEKMLDQRDLESASDAARGNVDDYRSLRFGMSTSKRYAKGDERKALESSLDQVEDRMDPRANEIVGEIEEAMKQAKRQMNDGDSPRLQQLQQQQQQVEQQAQKLSQEIDDASQEFPMIGNQLRPSMDGAKKQMKQAGESLGEGRTQRALDQERGALEQLRQLKDSMKKALQKQGQKGQQQPRDKVKIPGQEGPSTDEFRDAVKKGMKDDRLEDYSSEIERYYESLTE